MELAWLECGWHGDHAEAGWDGVRPPMNLSTTLNTTLNTA